MIRSYIRGGNGFIRSSIACHLICIILLNRRYSIKNVHLQQWATSRGCGFPKTGCYTFIGSLTSPYQAGFLAPGSSFLSPSHASAQWILRFIPLLQWPDRSGFSPDSLFLPAYNCQHLICSIWNYTDIIILPVTVFVNPIYTFRYFFIR